MNVSLVTGRNIILGSRQQTGRARGNTGRMILILGYWPHVDTGPETLAVEPQVEFVNLLWSLPQYLPLVI